MIHITKVADRHPLHAAEVVLSVVGPHERQETNRHHDIHEINICVGEIT